jgi:thymidylate synthase ThyX
MKRQRAKTTKRKPGRPTKWRAEFLQRAFSLCMSGATDVEMAKALGIAERTLNNYKKSHPEFMQAIEAGKLAVTQRVEKTLLLRALGEWTQPAVKIFNDNGAPMVVPYVEHFPPDIAAIKLYLHNRAPERWRDRVEVTGVNGGPVRVQQLSDDELMRIASGGG